MGVADRTRGHRTNNIDFLRLLFAGFVLVSHASELADGNRHREPLTRIFGTVSLGEVGVCGFFVLSGVLITQSWQRRPRVARFLVKRAGRIYPGFLMAAVVSLMLVAPLSTPEGFAVLWALPPFSLLWLLVLRLPPMPGTFPGQPYSYVNGSLWTLPLEFGCYMLTLGLGVSGILARRAIILAFWLGLLLFLVALREFNLAGPVAAAAVWLLVMFLAGILCQLYQVARYCGAHRAIAAATCLAVCLGQAGLAEIALATSGAYLLVCASYARPLPTLFHRLPDLSYGTYLYGWPIEQLMIRYCSASPSIVLIVSVPAALACGWASWTLIERPTLRLLDRCSTRTSFADGRENSLLQ